MIKTLGEQKYVYKYYEGRETFPTGAMTISRDATDQTNTWI